jgi:hypothetical protein
MLDTPDKVDNYACIKTFALHADAEEVSKADLCDIVCDEFIVLQVRIRYIGWSWCDRHVRLAAC